MCKCKIGCNWSNALSNLLISGEVNIDYIKAGAYGEFESQFEKIRSLKPILLHGLGHSEHTGMKNLDAVDFNRANMLIEKCSSPHYGLHLAIQNKDMQFNMTEEDIYVRMYNQIQIFKQKLCVPLLLENIPDTPEERTVFDHYPYASPEQIGRLLRETETQLLLDIAHAKITAAYRGWNIYEYLQALPLHLVREVHVDGSGYDEQGFPADTHQAMEDEDYLLLEWVLKYSQPDIVTLEYVGVSSEDEDVISRQLSKQLNEIRIAFGR